MVEDQYDVCDDDEVFNPDFRHPNVCGCSQCGEDDDNTSVETWCMMDGVDEIGFCDYFDIDPAEELCYKCWHSMRDEFEGMEADRASCPGGICGDAYLESKKANKKAIKESVGAGFIVQLYKAADGALDVIVGKGIDDASGFHEWLTAWEIDDKVTVTENIDNTTAEFPPELTEDALSFFAQELHYVYFGLGYEDLLEGTSKKGRRVEEYKSRKAGLNEKVIDFKIDIKAFCADNGLDQEVKFDKEGNILEEGVLGTIKDSIKMGVLLGKAQTASFQNGKLNKAKKALLKTIAESKNPHKISLAMTKPLQDELEQFYLDCIEEDARIEIAVKKFGLTKAQLAKKLSEDTAAKFAEKWNSSKESDHLSTFEKFGVKIPKTPKEKVTEEVAAELSTSGSKTYVTRVKTSKGKEFSAQDAGNIAKGVTDVNKFGDPEAAEEAGNIYAAASRVAKSVAHNLDKDPTKLSGEEAKRRTIATKFGKDSTDSWDIQAKDSKAIKDGQFLMNADVGDEKGIMTMKGDTLVQVKGNLDTKKEGRVRFNKRVVESALKEGVMSELLIDIEEMLGEEGIEPNSTLSIDEFEIAAQIAQDVIANNGLDPNMANEILEDDLGIVCESRKRSNRKAVKESSVTEDYGEPLGITIENAVTDTGIVFGNYDEDEGVVYVYLRDDEDPIATINWDVGFFDANTGDCEINFFAYDYASGNSICTLASSVEEVAKSVADYATFRMSVGC